LNSASLMKKFLKVVKNELNYLEGDRCFSIVVGDVFKNSEVIPLLFHIKEAALDINTILEKCK